MRTNRYSVPARLIGRRVRVMLHASELVVYDGQTEGDLRMGPQGPAADALRDPWLYDDGDLDVGEDDAAGEVTGEVDRYAARSLRR